jgi:tripartite-type tricarboxylate transporter receptor subunit TctC
MLALIAPGAAVVNADNYPSRTIRIVAPIAPGGGTDILSRVIAQKLYESWKQVVQVDNRPGAGGIIGSELVAKAAPDGYTLMMAFTSHVTNPSLQIRLPYDTIEDFAPISMVAVIPNVLLVHPSLPVRSVRDLIVFARARPGDLSYASSGTACHVQPMV